MTRRAYTPGYDPEADEDDDDDVELDDDEDATLDDGDEEWGEDEDDYTPEALARPRCSGCGERHGWQRAFVLVEGTESTYRRLWVVRRHDEGEFLTTHLVRVIPGETPYLVMVHRRNVILLLEWRDAVRLEDASVWRRDVRLDA